MVGADARPAVPALIRLLEDADEGPRNSACIAPRGIGPAATSALPALRRALSDRSADMRGFTRRAILAIETNLDGQSSPHNKQLERTGIWRRVRAAFAALHCAHAARWTRGHAAKLNCGVNTTQTACGSGKGCPLSTSKRTSEAASRLTQPLIAAVGGAQCGARSRQAEAASDDTGISGPNARSGSRILHSRNIWPHRDAKSASLPGRSGLSRQP
jgi:hypothetical protein